MRNYLLWLLLFCGLNLNAQQQKRPLFKNNDRVCFIGNSITNNGEFYNFIYLYYATRFPELKLSFFNCGISGDVASGILKRMDHDILIHKPNWTVLMVGMNDVNRSLYTPAGSAKPGVEKARKSALDVYARKTDTIVQILKKNTQVILQKPTIYDQTGLLKAQNAFGVNNALDSCGIMVEKLARKYNSRLIDYRTVMAKVNKDLQKKDPTATIIGPDRVHPGSAGHLLMAYQFLKQTNSPVYVSKISVDKGAKPGADLFNCALTNLKRTATELSFSCLEYSLPFPVKDTAAEALKWVPFTTDLNQQILKIAGLDSGNYELFIDGQLIASCSGQDLKQGLNLALIKQTPQYKQALKVMDLCMEYRRNEGLLRNLKFVEIGQSLNSQQLNDTALVKTILDKNLTKYAQSEHYNYYQTQFKNYLLNKPKQAGFEKKLEAIRTQIYLINKPVIHEFKLIRRH